MKTKSGERLPVTRARPKGETWILLSGCAATAQGSDLVPRVFDGKTLSEARFVPLQMKQGQLHVSG